MRMYVENSSGSKSSLARAVSAEIRARLAAKRISGKKLAHHIGLSQNYVAKRLRDEAPFTIDDIELIVEALDVEEEAAHFISAAYERQGDLIWAEMEDEAFRLSEVPPIVDRPEEFGLAASTHEFEDEQPGSEEPA